MDDINWNDTPADWDDDNRCGICRELNCKDLDCWMKLIDDEPTIDEDEEDED